MDEDIRLVKKDLAVILKLDRGLDYSAKESVKKYYEQLVRADMLTTGLGQSYRKKLEQIVDGDDGYASCLFCGGGTSKDTVICKACMDRLKKLPGENGGANTAADGAKTVPVAVAAALIVLCVLCGLVGGFLHWRTIANRDIVNYLGATEKTVQRRSDESRFLDILCDGDERITTVWLRSDLIPAFHAGGLYIGDGRDKAERCMEKLDAAFLSETRMDEDTVFLQYTFWRNRKKILAGITVTEGKVSDIIVTCQ